MGIAPFARAADAFGAALKLHDALPLVHVEVLSPALAARFGYSGGFSADGRRRRQRLRVGVSARPFRRPRERRLQRRRARCRDLRATARSRICARRGRRSTRDGAGRACAMRRRPWARSSARMPHAASHKSLSVASLNRIKARETLARWRSAAHAAHGHLRVLAAAPALRSHLDFFDEPPAGALKLMRRLKTAFDPARSFQPRMLRRGTLMAAHRGDTEPNRARPAFPGAGARRSRIRTALRLRALRALPRVVSDLSADAGRDGFAARANLPDEIARRGADRRSTTTSCAISISCLGCRGCETACPSGVHYGRLLERARDFVDRNHRRGFDRRVAPRGGPLHLSVSAAAAADALAAARRRAAQDARRGSPPDAARVARVDRPGTGARTELSPVYPDRQQRPNSAGPRRGGASRMRRAGADALGESQHRARA